MDEPFLTTAAMDSSNIVRQLLKFKYVRTFQCRLATMQIVRILTITQRPGWAWFL